MSQTEDSLIEGFLQKLREDDSFKDFLKEIVRTVLEEIMELEMAELLKAEKYERSSDREGHRNGYRDRNLHTRVGTLNLRVPRDREGNFSSLIFGRYQRSEKALVLALQEMYIQGVSTRRVKEITEKLCGTEFSKDQVSRAASKLDEQLARWRNRPLDESEGGKEERFYPYLIIDARYEKVREDGRVRDRGVLMVEGIDNQGYREILSVHMKTTESEVSWSEVFSDLVDRGLDQREVVYIVSDKHKGMRKAIAKYFPNALWQWCQTHYQRNAGAKISTKKKRKALHDRLRDVFNSPNLKIAQARAEQLIKHYEGSYPDLSRWLEETIEEALTVFNLPRKHRRRLRTNNGLERFNGEIDRRTQVIRIFPNRGSCLRLVTAMCVEQSEEWLTGRRYVDMDKLKEWGYELEGEPEGGSPPRPMLQKEREVETTQEALTV